MVLLNCVVSDAQRSSWTRHLAPAMQPLFLTSAQLKFVDATLHLPRWTRAEFRALNYPLSLHDTFTTYHVASDAEWVMLFDEGTFRTLDTVTRARLLDIQREHGRGGLYDLEVWRDRLDQDDLAVLRESGTSTVVLWASVWQRLSARGQDVILHDVVTFDRLPHRGGELDEVHWREIDRALPGVRALAGTFAWESGANCLSTVVAAFGVPGVADVWLHSGPFERWLRETTRPVKEHDLLGTVLVWRDASKRVQHAAVSLGRSWVFQKDAQGWFAPRQVLSFEDVMNRWHDESWTVEAWR